MKIHTGKHWVLLAAICATGSAWAGHRDRPTAKSRSATEDDIREVVFRRLLKKETPEERRFVGFLAVNGNRSPSAALMARFRSVRPPLKPFSKCTRSPQSNGHWVREKGTGKEGIIFNVDSIKWRGTQAADVHAGSYVGGRWGSGATYEVALKRGQWVMVAVKDAYRS